MILHQNQYIMGFSLGAIKSNKNNRNLQRKQSDFGLGKSGLTGKGFFGQKAPIDEINMQKIAQRSLLIEIVFYVVVFAIAFAGVYFWVG